MLPVNPDFTQFGNSERIKLSSVRVRIIEDCTCINSVEKVMLISLMIGDKWVADIGIDREKDFDDIAEFLSKLGLPWAKQLSGADLEKTQWLQVAATRAALNYVIGRRNELSVIEAGILYGYAPSHVLAYANLLSNCRKKCETIEAFYFLGVYSEDFYRQEQKWAQRQWRKIVKISPRIASEAREYYEEKVRTL